MKDLLDKVQEDYKNFCNKEYIFYLDNGININLKCKKENLPHLIGLHKLDKEYSVIRQMVDRNDYTVTPKNIFIKLKEFNISYDDFKKCDTWTKRLENRMENFTFEKLDSILKKTTMFTFIYDKKKTKNNKAKYVMVDKKGTLFVHLYIGYDKNLQYYYPNSFVASEEKDSNLSRKTIKVLKSEIYKLSIDGREKIEIIEHAKIREIRTLIKTYNSNNSKLYKKINKNEEVGSLLKEINGLAIEIINKYDKLEMCSDKDLNDSIDKFLKLKNKVKSEI